MKGSSPVRAANFFEYKLRPTKYPLRKPQVGANKKPAAAGDSLKISRV